MCDNPPAFILRWDMKWVGQSAGTVLILSVNCAS